MLVLIRLPGTVLAFFLRGVGVVGHPGPSKIDDEKNRSNEHTLTPDDETP